jgi:small subunit ribosomal protein S21
LLRINKYQNKVEDNLKMTQIILGDQEGIESALRRFKRKVSHAGIFPDMKKNRFFETPIEKSKRKAISKQKQRKISRY